MIISLKASGMAAKPNVRGWLKFGSDYLVLAVETVLGRSCYRLESDDNRTPALFEAGLFKLVDNRLPTSWIAVQQDELPIQLMPRAWSESGFWERFFDGDPGARRAYEDAVRRMQDESSIAEDCEAPD